MSLSIHYALLTTQLHQNLKYIENRSTCFLLGGMNVIVTSVLSGLAVMTLAQIVRGWGLIPIKAHNCFSSCHLFDPLVTLILPTLCVCEKLGCCCFPKEPFSNTTQICPLPISCVQGSSIRVKYPSN